MLYFKTKYHIQGILIVYCIENDKKTSKHINTQLKQIFILHLIESADTEPTGTWG